MAPDPANLDGISTGVEVAWFVMGCCGIRISRSEDGVRDLRHKLGLKLLFAANPGPSTAGLPEPLEGGFSLDTRPFAWTKALERT